MLGSFQSIKFISAVPATFKQVILSAVISYRVQAGNEADLDAYGTVSIAFEVTQRLDLEDPDLGALPVAPWVKDYDSYGTPAQWRDSFDLRNWFVISAWDARQRIGGAVVAFDTPGIDMLEGRQDLAVLWDIRVAPDRRGHGIGHALFFAAMKLARKLECTELKIETQDINVPACRFYASRGCVISQVSKGAYESLPDEAMILWRLPLRRTRRHVK